MIVYREQIYKITTMAAKRQADSNTNNVHVYEGAVKWVRINR
jgi:hypothetical protein